MILLPSVPLPKPAKDGLRGFQKEVNKQRGFAARVVFAKELFGRKNTATNFVFRHVRTTLKLMCSGSCRCCYCEDSCADEVEHVHPKSLYPELTFVWENYIYACGPCNGPKKDKFTVIDTITGQLVDVTPKRKAPVTRPHPGQPALIDPRKEDPMDLMKLDLCGTFQFVPIFSKGTVQYMRADETIRILNLKREILRKSRENAFYCYKALLYEYADESAKRASLT
ncbi:MAG: hypothetical protein NTX50_30265, partial [Candidatus Sumerlaeota bacterium]|nr:hypothetical protein [Candidatus Sumerlaeota bacterium]